MRYAILFIAMFAAACGGVDINDRAVFQPPAHDAPAQTVDELTARFPSVNLHDAVPDAVAQQGFVGAGETRIAYTYITRPGANRPLIFYCGGNGSDRVHSGVYFAQKTLPWGDVVMFDYPGYGDSPGEPSSAAIDRAAPALSALATRLAQGRTLVFWGHSLGGFVCADVVRQTPETDAVVLEATARNAMDVGRAWRPWYAAPFVRLSVDPSLARFDVADALHDFHGPILLMGAKRDRVLPIRLSRELNAALRTRNARVTYVEFPRAEHLSISLQPSFSAVASPFFASLAGHS